MAKLSINRLIRVAVSLAPAAAQMQNISSLLILGSSNVIDIAERYRTYIGITDIAKDFGTSAPEYLAAALWFEQTPQPSSLQIGRWAKTATNATLKGATLSVIQQSIDSWNAFTSGAFFLVANGIPCSVTGVNLASATNLNGVASTLQTALSTLSPDAAVVWNANYGRFEVSSGITGAASTLSFISAPTASGFFSFAANPTAADTITIGGTVITFVTALTTGNQVLIGVDLAATLTNLKTFCQSSVDANLVKFNYYTNGIKLYVSSVATGVAGNALTLAKSSANVTLSGATLTGGTGVDLSTSLAATSTSSGAYTAQGMAAESAVDAVTVFDDNYGQNWYALTVCGASNADHLAIAPFIQGTSGKHIYGVSTTEAGTLSALSTTDIAYQLSQLDYGRTIVQYSSSNPYAVVSLIAKALTVNYNGNNTVITLMYKQEPGIVPESVNVTQINALEAKHCNIFVAYNNDTAIIEQGVTSSGDFIDIITGTDWLALDIQTQVYNLLYSNNTKVPQTDAGNNLIATTIEAVCSKAVDNGLLAAGVWQSGGFGTLQMNDYLPKGFYIYTPPIATQAANDRGARKSVPFQIAAKLAGAIHTADIAISVNR